MNAPTDTNATAPEACTQGRIITSLAELPANALVDEKELARLLNRTDRTIRKMVSRFELPPPIQFGGRSTWVAGKVIEWIIERADRAASKAQERERKINGVRT